ncbi:MAG: hypothetical protein RLZZ84_805 [Pseudomonadota bacterium]|jgi:hypothetical protein
MVFLIILTLAAAMPLAATESLQAASPPAPPAGPAVRVSGVQVTGLASAEILRGATDAPEAPGDAVLRRVRPRQNGQVQVEFD